MALTRPKYSQIYDTDWKQSVELTTTGDVGNLVAGNVQPSSVDSVNLSVGNRILVKDQTSKAQNGIYIVRSVGTGSDGWWVRSMDGNQSSFVTSGLTVTVSQGTVNAGREYRLSTPDPITLGTTDLSFLQVGAQPVGANTYVQFNDMNIMGGSPGFTFEKTSNSVSIVGSITTNNIVANSNVNVGGNLIVTSAGQFSGQFNESISTAGIFVGNASSLGTPTPRIGFFNGNTTQNWQIDNSFGDFRWFVPGSVKLNLNPTGNLTVYGSILPASNVAYDLGNPTQKLRTGYFGGELHVGANTYVTGSIVPTANIAYDLGTPTQRFRSAYFSGNTVYIGGESMSVADDGTWSFTSKGAEVSLGLDAVFNPPAADISGNLTVAGNLTVGGVFFANNSPGQNGYVLRSTGTGIVWAAPSAGTAIDSGTSNVSILGSSADVVTTVNGSIVTRVSPNTFTVNGNLAINGNLFVNGNVTTINANNLNINDSLIYLADDNPSDIIDIGIVSSFTPGGGSYQHTGLVRDASDGIWKLFAGVADEPTTTVNFDGATYSTLRVGNIYAGGTTANDGRFLQSVAGGLAWTAATNVSDGPTSATASSTAFTIVANGTDAARFYNDIVYVYPDLDLSANLLVAGVADITGNLSAAYFIGDGSQLTGLPAGYTDSDVAAYLPTYSGVLRVASSVTAIINGGTSGQGNIGASGGSFNTVFAKSTSAQYADLAEVYASDKKYVPGTVVVFGGNKEVTISTASHDPAIAGVVSTDPAYLMNDSAEGVAVALQGRVPCRVKGPVTKGDRVVSSDQPGIAVRLDKTLYEPGCIIGKAIEDIVDDRVHTIEVVVGRN